MYHIHSDLFFLLSLRITSSKLTDIKGTHCILEQNKFHMLPPLSSAIWISFGLMAWLASRSTEIRSLACFMLLGVKKVYAVPVF